jgi:hypothetical protein
MPAGAGRVYPKPKGLLQASGSQDLADRSLTSQGNRWPRSARLSSGQIAGENVSYYGPDPAPGTTGEFRNLAAVKERDPSSSSSDMLRDLVNENEVVTRTVRAALSTAQAAGDEATAGLLADRLAFSREADLDDEEHAAFVISVGAMGRSRGRAGGAAVSNFASA